jgi:uncharacterized protein
VRALLIFVAAGVAGAINSVAGGGTLLSFPALIWLGVPSIAANATSTIALWPGSLGSVWGYRRELRGTERRLYVLVAPSLLGGLIGAVLVYRTPPQVFDRLVPVLILFATCLFMAQEPLQRRLRLTATDGTSWLSWAVLFQFGVGLYGGYFGAGIGILMLAALSLMGYTDIHHMNGVKSVLAVCINGIAAAYFATTGLVVWSDAAVMAVGAILGGVAGAGVARRLGQSTVRALIVAIGLSMAVSLMLRL